MMRPVGEDLKIYLHREPVDMRLGRNGLAALAQGMMRDELFLQQKARVQGPAPRCPSQ